jgi:hypothetical protein
MYTELWWGNLVEMPTWETYMNIDNMGHGWNWLIIVSSGGMWYFFGYTLLLMMLGIFYDAVSTADVRLYSVE